MTTNSPLPQPTQLQIAAAWLVLMGCELALAGCWAMFIQLQDPTQNNYDRLQQLRIAMIPLLLSLFPAWLAIRQYQAMFRHSRVAASTTIGMLVTAAIFLSIPLFDAIPILTLSRGTLNPMW